MNQEIERDIKEIKKLLYLEINEIIDNGKDKMKYILII